VPVDRAVARDTRRPRPLVHKVSLEFSVSMYFRQSPADRRWCRSDRALVCGARDRAMSPESGALSEGSKNEGNDGSRNGRAIGDGHSVRRRQRAASGGAELSDAALLAGRSAMPAAGAAAHLRASWTRCAIALGRSARFHEWRSQCGR